MKVKTQELKRRLTITISQAKAIHQSYDHLYEKSIVTIPDNEDEDLSHQTLHDHSRCLREKWRAILSVFEDINIIFERDFIINLKHVNVRQNIFDDLRNNLRDYRAMFPAFLNHHWDTQYLHALKLLEDHFELWLNHGIDLEQFIEPSSNFITNTKVAA